MQDISEKLTIFQDAHLFGFFLESNARHDGHAPVRGHRRHFPEQIRHFLLRLLLGNHFYDLLLASLHHLVAQRLVEVDFIYDLQALWTFLNKYI